MIKRYHNCYIWFLNLIKAAFFKLVVQSTSAVLKQYIESVFPVCIAWYKHERGWENSWQLCKPETKCTVCITVENSPNPSSINIRLCKYRENVFYCFYKLTSPRKNALLWHRLKKEILILYTNSCTRFQYLFCKTMTSKIRIFFRLKCQLKWKKKNAAYLLRFSKFQPTREWVNKVNLSSFQLKN